MSQESSFAFNYSHVVNELLTVPSQTLKRNARSSTWNPCLSLMRQRRNSCSRLRTLILFYFFNFGFSSISCCLFPTLTIMHYTCFFVQMFKKQLESSSRLHFRYRIEHGVPLLPGQMSCCQQWGCSELKFYFLLDCSDVWELGPKLVLRGSDPPLVFFTFVFSLTLWILVVCSSCLCFVNRADLCNKSFYSCSFSSRINNVGEYLKIPAENWELDLHLWWRIWSSWSWQCSDWRHYLLWTLLKFWSVLRNETVIQG